MAIEPFQHAPKTVAPHCTKMTMSKKSSEVSLFCYHKNMQLEFPYQIAVFLGKEPDLNEPVYYGDSGWYPQIAIKRRFKLDGVTEEKFIEELKDFFDTINTPTISTGGLVKPEHMPVRVIPTNNQAELKMLHENLLNKFGAKIISRYPEREGKNYYPHVTAEYNGEFVIPVDEYTNKSFDINNVWLLKDTGDENSQAYCKIR